MTATGEPRPYEKHCSVVHRPLTVMLQVGEVRRFSPPGSPICDVQYIPVLNFSHWIPKAIDHTEKLTTKSSPKPTYSQCEVFVVVHRKGRITLYCV